MPVTYNRVAGQNAERLAALSDGIFAFAMTLLVLDIPTPSAGAIHSERALLHALAALSPKFLTYLMSFLTLGIFWVGQQTQLNHLSRSDRNLTWLHIAFLAAVSILPFSTRLLSEFLEYRTALIEYWANVFVLGLALYLTWGYAVRAKILRDDISEEVTAAVCRRIIFGQSLYAVGAGLCVVNTRWSIAFIVAVQIYYASGLRIPERVHKA
ncbi:MAG TPA: TMEM175 family protein [Candidatus Aquilonibacter sp.]|nr:TMEM175 family protein [Candidatus Aquilonibacter sp.]